MMKTPSQSHSTPPLSPVTRYRRWAAHLILIVASIGTVATSPVRSPEVISQYGGPPLTLTTDAPKATRHLRVRVSAEKHSSESVEVDLRAQVTAHWRPANPNSTVKPWLVARVHLPSELSPSPGQGEVLVLGEPGQPVTVQTGAFADCELGRSCEWNAPLELELQPNAAEGTVDVEWMVTAVARSLDTDELPKGFTVRVSEN